MKNHRTVDLRSDTVTLPTTAMRQAMFDALLGDDVYGEDPTINRLEALAAERLGKEAALFVPSGTMANLVCLLAHCARGDEVIMGDSAHTFLFEAGSSAAVGGIHPSTLPNQPDGTLELRAVEAAIRDPKNDHYPRSRLICLENSHNRCGGAVLAPAYMAQVRELADRHGLAIHLDGARIFNAAAALDVGVSALAHDADSVSFCLSKGLAAPVGSLVCGSSRLVQRARRQRKMLGGGMRQAGVIAACGLYALKHHIERLEDDHQTARELAYGLRKVMSESYRIQEPQSNILLVHTNSKATTATTIQEWSKVGILALAISDTCIRLVTHLDLPPGSVKEAVNRITR